MEKPGLFNHGAAVFFLPFVTLGVVPGLLLHWTSSQELFGMRGVYRTWLWGGALVAIIAGVLILSHCISMFHRYGFGTLAPWDPTKKLVVRGLYRHVRNPMLLGVVAVLAGECVIFGSPAILAWLIIFFIGNTIYLAWGEEPGLYKRFGEDYQAYMLDVPRWIPRWKPWIQG